MNHKFKISLSIFIILSTNFLTAQNTPVNKEDPEHYAKIADSLVQIQSFDSAYLYRKLAFNEYIKKDSIHQAFNELFKHSNALIRYRLVDKVELLVNIVSDSLHVELYKDQFLDAKLNSLQGWVHSKRRNLDLAESYFSKATEYFSSQNDSLSKIELADNLNETAIHFAINQKYFKSKEQFKILSTLLENGDFNNPKRRLSSLYNNLGNLHQIIGDFEQAVDYYRKSLDLKIELYGDVEHPDLGFNYNNIGIFYFAKLGLFDQAIPYLVKASKVHKSNSNIEAYLESNSNLNLCYCNTENIQIGIEGLKKNLSIIENKNLNLTQRTIVLSNLLNCYRNADDYSSMHQILNKINHINSKLNVNNQDLIILESNFQYSLFSCLLKPSKTNLSGLIDILKKKQVLLGKRHPSSISNLNELADIFLKNNLYDSAIKYVNLSINNNINSFNKKIDLSNGHISGKELIVSLKIKSNAQYLKYKINTDKKILNELNKTIDNAEKLMIQLSNSFIINSELIKINQNYSDILSIGVQSSYIQYRNTKDVKYVDRILYFIERSKSANLFQHLSRKHINTQPKDTLFQQKKDQLLKIAYLESKFNTSIENKDPEQKVKNIEEQITDERIRLDEINFKIDQQTPTNLKKINNKFTKNIASIQNELNDKIILFNYFKTDSSLFRLTIQKNDFSIIETPIDSTFKNKINGYKKLISNPSIERSEFNQFIQLSNYLYDLLIKDIKEKNHTSDFIIIPHGSLALIPFETLITTLDNNPLGYDDLHYLFKENNISYANSISLYLLNQERSQSKKMKDLLSFAPSFENYQLNPTIKLDSIERSSIVPLVWASREVESISKEFKSESFQNNKATEDKFKELSSQYKYLHLATHGIINDKNPQASKIVFANSDSTSKEDGFLYLSELLPLEIDAEMVVLSACNTGAGEIIDGEGVISFSRSFFYAGARSVVMSLWAANDKSSHDIMTNFYSSLSNGYNKAEALRKAKLDYLNVSDGSKHHPYYWSHFIISGNTRAIKTKAPILFITIGIISLLIASIVFYAIYKKREIN